MWFALVLRFLGASQVVSGLTYFVTAYNVHMGYYNPTTETAAAFLTHGLESVALGAILVFGAAHISALFVSPLPTGAQGPDSGIPANV
jgi:hypothetical protein